MEKSLKHRFVSRYRKNNILSKFLSISGNRLENKKWIFIIGCYNSGTTLLDQILASHPEIGGLPDEGVILTDQLNRPEDYGWRRMWYKCYEELKNQEPDASVVKKHWSHFYDYEKPFLLEKSIANTCRIPFILKNFEPVYFIHLVRNGYAVAEGIHRKAKPLKDNPYYDDGHYPMELCIKQWISSLKEVNKYKADIPNFLELTYEDLCENTEETLHNITNYLALGDFPKEIHSSSFSVHEKDSKIRNMNLKSLSKLSLKEKLVINNLAKDYLKQYGYSIIT